MAFDDGARRRGGIGGGLWSKYSVVFLAVVICILNLYMYLSPAAPRKAAAADGGKAGGNMERPGPDASSFLAKRPDSSSKQQGTDGASSSKGDNKQKEGQASNNGAKPGSLADRALARDKSRKKNVLFVMTDDLRPSLSIYDKPVISPAFERLARGGVVFERAYNQDPICNPSRNSLLSGRRPDTTRTWLFENTVPHHFSNIFKYFKDEGKYKVYGTGKLWHWTNTYMDDFHNEYFPPTTEQWNKGTDENYPMMNASVQPDRNWPEERYWDARIAAEGIRLMRELAEGQKEAGAGAEPQPWFLGIGFHQPHRPWHFPLKYWDLYDNVPIPTTPHLTMPKDAPSVASGDVNPHEISLLPDGKKRYWADPLTGGVGLDGIRENVRGYHASVSFLDNQLKKILDELEKLDLAKDTIVVFCVDHGMNIGDHGHWDKRTLYETNARVPLIIRDPDIPESFGANASALVENVDIFPTLIEMAGLPDPKDRVFPPLEGKSLVPLLKDPKGSVKDFAITQIARCCSNGCGKIPVEEVPWNHWEVCKGGNWEWNKFNERTYMGYGLRTDAWRYVLWVPWNTTTFAPMWDQPFGGEELYDHRDQRCNAKGNFDLCETQNVAKDESLAGTKDELYAKLRSIADTYNLNAWEALRAEKEAKSNAQTRLLYHHLRP